MFTIVFGILLILLIAGGIYLYMQYNIALKKATGGESVKSKPLAQQSTPVKTGSSKARWKAVKVETGLICCKRAEKIRDQVFLSAEAPVFPLPGCRQKACECRYIHMSDRRDGDDRRESTDYSMTLLGTSNEDRRKIKDRRAGIL